MDLYKQQMLKEWLSEIWLVSIKERWGQKKNGKNKWARNYWKKIIVGDYEWTNGPRRAEYVCPPSQFYPVFPSKW